MVHVLQHMPLQDLLTIGKSSRNFHRLSRDDSLWSNLFARHFGADFDDEELDNDDDGDDDSLRVDDARKTDSLGSSTDGGDEDDDDGDDGSDDGSDDDDNDGDADADEHADDDDKTNLDGQKQTTIDTKSTQFHKFVTRWKTLQMHFMFSSGIMGLAITSKRIKLNNSDADDDGVPITTRCSITRPLGTKDNSITSNLPNHTLSPHSMSYCETPPGAFKPITIKAIKPSPSSPSSSSGKSMLRFYVGLVCKSSFARIKFIDEAVTWVFVDGDDGNSISTGGRGFFHKIITPTGIKLWCTVTPAQHKGKIDGVMV